MGILLNKQCSKIPRFKKSPLKAKKKYDTKHTTHIFNTKYTCVLFVSILSISIYFWHNLGIQKDPGTRSYRCYAVLWWTRRSSLLVLSSPCLPCLVLPSPEDTLKVLHIVLYTIQVKPVSVLGPGRTGQAVGLCVPGQTTVATEGLCPPVPSPICDTSICSCP